MNLSIMEMEELTEMKENIRRSIEALEVCCSCDYISECVAVLLDDEPPVWLCKQCHARLQERSRQIRWPIF